MQKALWSNSISTHSSKIACYTLFWMKCSPSNSLWNFIAYGLINNIQYLLLFKSKIFQIIFSKSYLTREGFPTIPRACRNSPILFSFLLKWISSEKKFVWYSIICSTEVETLWKPTCCNPVLIEGFSMVLRTHQEAPWLGRSQHDKQTKWYKQTTFLHRYIFHVLGWGG